MRGRRLCSHLSRKKKSQKGSEAKLQPLTCLGGVLPLASTDSTLSSLRKQMYGLFAPPSFAVRLLFCSFIFCSSLHHVLFFLLLLLSSRTLAATVIALFLRFVLSSSFSHLVLLYLVGCTAFCECPSSFMF